MSDLTHAISLTLADHADEYDIDAIADALRERGAHTIDDVTEAEYWTLIENHALPDEPDTDALTGFLSEIEAVIATPPGAPARWQRGGVTLEMSGHSRVSMRVPEIATYTLTVAGHPPVRLTTGQGSSWASVWQTVEAALEEWTTEVARLRADYDQALAAEEKARQAVARATARTAQARDALAAVTPGETPERLTMTREEVAELLGIQVGSVRRQMSRWGIEATYERGRNGRTVAHYPTAEVKAHARTRES